MLTFNILSAYLLPFGFDMIPLAQEMIGCRNTGRHCADDGDAAHIGGDSHLGLESYARLELVQLAQLRKNRRARLGLLSNGPIIHHLLSPKAKHNVTHGNVLVLRFPL
jgi:hypothetical protein